MALPVFDDDWFQQDAGEKIRRFTAAGTTLDEIRSIADEATIQWMMNEGGWKPARQIQRERVYVEPEPVYVEPKQQDQAAEAARQEAARQEALRQEALRQEAARQEAIRQEAIRQEAAIEEARRQEAARLEAFIEEIIRQEAARQEAARQEAIRQEAARQEAIRQEAIRQEAERQEAARQEAARQEAARQEAARQEAARQEAARQEAARQEAARVEADRQESIRQENRRQEMLRQEAIRLETERVEAARQEAARQEAARVAAEQSAARNAAANVGVNLPSNWFDLDAQGKAQWLVGARVTERQIVQVAGVSGLDALKQYGYYDVLAKEEADAATARQEAARQEAARVEAARQEAARVEAARQEAARVEAARVEAARVEAARQEAARLEAERIEAQRAEAARVEAIRQEQIRAQQLAEQQEAARQEAARQEAARVAAERTASENQVKSLYQEVLGRQPTAEELSQYVTKFGTSIDASEKNIFSRDVSTEVLKNKLLAGNPDGDELTRRVVIEAVNNKWTPQQTLDFVNTQFGVNKTMADYERAVSNFFAPAVANLLANGKTEADIRQLGADQGIIPSVIDAAVRNNIGQISKNDILSKTANLIKTSTENNQTFQTLDVPGLIKFADDNKLSYDDVASALATKFPTLKTSDLVFEKDRQQISTLAKDTVDPKDSSKTIKSVSYADALKEAITKGISLENLARFFGQTSEQFKTTISSNLGSFADSLRASGVNAEAGLSDLLGIQPKDTTAALQTVDTDKAITGSLKQKEAGGLTYNEILDEVEASGMTIDDFVTRYFGQGKTDLLTGLKSEAEFTPEQRDLRDDYNAFASTFNKDNPLTYSKISDYLASKQLTDAQAVSLFGIPAKDLGDYRRDTFITSGLNQLEKSDNRLDYTEIVNFAKENFIPFTEVAKYLATPDKQESLVKTLQDTQTDMGRSPAERLEFQLNQITNSGKQSGTWDKNEGWEHHADKMTTYLTNLGVTDLRNIATKVENRQTQDAFTSGDGDSTYTDYRTVTVPHVVYYDKTTGKELHAADQRYNNGAWEFGSEGSGKGSTGYILAPTSKDGVGGVGVTSQWREKYGVQEYAMPLAFVAAVAAPYLLPEIIGAAPAAVAGVEGVAAQAALTGTGLTGSLMAAGVPASVAGYAATAIVNGVYNGVVAEATGGDFDKAFINGGVAPVLGQLATNAVNSMVTGLPSGVASAVGNAVTQLISTGEIDPGQLAMAGIKPTAVQTIIDASGGALNAATARLVFDTVASGGKNITSLAANPAGVINFVVKNQGVFNNIATAAATGTDQKPAAADISSLDTVQQEVLTSQPRTETIQGEALFQDINQTELGRETAQIGIVKPPGEMITTDTSGTPTGQDPYAGYDNAVKFAEALASGATEFDGVEAAIKLRQALSSGALDFYNYDLGKLEAQLVGNQPTLEKARQAAETLYGEGASFNYGGKFYEGTLGQTVLKDDKGNEYRISKEATLITNPQGSVTGYTLNGKTYDYRGNEISTKAPVAEVPGSTEVPDARLPNGMYSLQGFRAAGGGKDAEDYRSYVIAANELINKTGSAKELNPSAYNIAAARASDMSTRAGIVSTSAAYTQPTQAPLSSYSAAGSPYLAGFGHMAMAVGSSGATLVEGMLRGLNQTEAADRVAEASMDAYRASQNIAATSPDVEKTLAVSSGVLSGLGILLGGGAAWSTAIAPTITSMNATFRDGQERGLSDIDNLTRTLGNGAAEYIGEIISNKVLLGAVKGISPGTSVAIRDSLVDGYSKLPSNATAQQIKDMVGAWAKINGVEQFTEGVTTALQIANDRIYNITDTTPKDSKELADLVKSQVETVFGATNIALGLGGGAYAASRAANLGALSIEYVDKVAREPFDKTIQDIVDVTPVVQTVGLLTGPNNQAVLNSQEQPILLQALANQPNLTVVSNEEGVIPNEFSVSTPTETVFDLVFDNEGKGYTVNSVNLDGNIFNVTMADGKAGTINAIDLQNNALNLITQADPVAAKALQESGDLTAVLSKELAKTVNLNAVSQGLNAGSVVAVNDKGAFVLTSNGTLAFAPNIDSSTGGVSLTKLNMGDSVVIGNGYVAPAMKEIDASGGVQVKVDELKINPLSGFGRVIGLDESQALVVSPNQELLTINRSSLTPTQNQVLTQGSLVPYSENTVTQRGVTADTAMSTFGLTQEQLLQGMTTPSAADRLPVLVNINTPTGASVINTALPDVSVGKVVSIDPTLGTALVSTALGNPQVINLQGITATQGSDIFFNPSTNTILGTPVVSTPTTQTQPQGLVSLVAGTYTPVGTPTINTVTGVQPTAPVSLLPPISTVLPQASIPGGLQIDTIPGLGVDTIPGVTVDTITTPIVDTITTPVQPVKPVVPGVKIPTIPLFPSLFFPIQKAVEAGTIDYGYPTVPPPELSGSYEMPYPNYLRPLDPYLGYGLGTLMGDLNAQEQRNGGDQPLQNAQAQAAPAP